MSDEIQTAEPEAEEGGLIAYMFTNHKEQGFMLQQLLDMFYRGAFSNTIGIGSFLNNETDEEELLLVGVDHGDDGITRTYPLAKVFGPTEASKYTGPDGQGGWLDDNEEAEANVH
jgi:hypothetical protein